MNDSDILVQVRDLRKRYGSITAVDGVTFSLRRGEIFGLLGPNGAGKTTTIGMIAGLVPPTEGEIQMAGRNTRHASVETKRTMGIVPQELAIYPRLTARENLEFFGRLYALSGKALTNRVTEMLRLVGLEERADSQAETYSGGMKRRLNLAAGLMHSPQLLLLDEPTVGVDPQSRNHIFEGVRALNRAGLTILYTSHYMEEVEALCDRVGIMDGGKLIACDTVPNLISRLGSAIIEVSIEPTGPLDTLIAALCAQDPVESVEFLPANSELTASSALPGAGVLRIRAGSPNLALPGLVTGLNAAGISLLSLSIKQPDLEDVFLALTGKTLRD